MAEHHEPASPLELGELARDARLCAARVSGCMGTRPKAAGANGVSILAAIFGWTRLPQWALELLVIAGLAGGFWFYHRHVYDTGIQAQQAADQKVSAAAIAQAAVATQAAQDAANRAEESYREEIARNTAAAASRAIGPVRVCIDASAGNSGVPKGSASTAGTPSASAPSGRIPQMPARDPGIRPEQHPDISGLLDLFAQRADDGSAVIREFQSRGH